MSVQSEHVSKSDSRKSSKRLENQILIKELYSLAAAGHYCFITCKDDEQRKFTANNLLIFIIICFFDEVLFHKWGIHQNIYQIIAKVESANISVEGTY